MLLQNSYCILYSLNYYNERKDLFNSKFEMARQRVQDHDLGNLIISRYKVGDHITFQDNEAYICGGGMITKGTKPGEKERE
jgi:hypothetical protein